MSTPNPKLPAAFQFSQSNLQDFVDCRRRFQLRWLLRLSWPAIETEPALEREREMQRGAAFHHLLQQHILGIPAERLSAMVHDPALQTWWENYLAFTQAPGEFAPLWQPETRRFPEIALSAPLGSHRLLAKYDLLAILPDGRVIIVDWKTSRSLTRRKYLVDRLQTRVYPHLLLQAGGQLYGGPILPEQVEMVYWFAGYPDQPERFPYSPKAHRADQEYLDSLVNLIQRLEGDDFSLTQDETRCRYCIYRSLCDRGVKAGDLTDMETEPELAEALELDFEQISEVAYDMGAATLD